MDSPQTKKFDLDAHASTSSSSSFDSLSSHLSDSVNAIEPSHNLINSTTANTRRAVAPKSKYLCVTEKKLSSWLSSQHSSVTSHQIREHGIRHAAAAMPAQDMKSYSNCAATNLKAVHEFVEEMCNTAGCDEEAIDTLKMALIHDNEKSNKEMAHTQDNEFHAHRSSPVLPNQAADSCRKERWNLEDDALEWY